MIKQKIRFCQAPDSSLEQIQFLNDLHKKSTNSENAVRIVNCFDRTDVSESAGRVTTPALILHAKNETETNETLLKLSLLTRREKEVLELLAQGFKNSQIAGLIKLSRGKK